MYFRNKLGKTLPYYTYFTRYIGDQIVEWNGIDLAAKSYEEVQAVINQPNGEIELLVRP